MNSFLTLSAEQQAPLKRIQSSAPTRYRLKVETEEVYAFCAYDALLYTLLIGQPVTREAQLPTAARFTIDLTPEGPRRFNLWQSFAEQDAPLPKFMGMPSSRCPYLHQKTPKVGAKVYRSTEQNHLHSSTGNGLAAGA